MRCGLNSYLGVYAVLDIILALLSLIGWVYYWKLTRQALFLQRYEQLKSSNDPMLEDLVATYQKKPRPVGEENSLLKQQEYISLFCGRGVFDSLNIDKTLLEFDGIITSVLTPSMALCCLAMIGFIVGGILIGIMSFGNDRNKSSALGWGIGILITEVISTIVLMAGALVVLDTRLCAAEFLYRIRTCLIGSVFFTLCLYKFYELIMIIHFVRVQSKISTDQSVRGTTQNGDRAVG